MKLSGVSIFENRPENLKLNVVLEVILVLGSIKLSIKKGKSFSYTTTMGIHYQKAGVYTCYLMLSLVSTPHIKKN